MSNPFPDLPEIDFLETDAAVVEQAVITKYEEITGKSLSPGSPERLFLEGLAAIIAQQRVIINDSAKMNLLAYATGDFLDHLGALTDTERLPAAAATVTMKFEISEALGFDVVIPEGARVTPDGNLMFETTEEATITAGNTEVEVLAQCQTAGADGTGYVAGQITRLVDLVENITSVANTDTSAGGTDAEEDGRYKLRIQLSPEKFSTAGPKGAYVFWALTAHQDIIDVAAYSTDGTVYIRPLMVGGELPDAGTLALVEAALSDEQRIPLTDTLDVAAPSQVSYDIDLTYYILESDTTLVSQIQAAVTTAVDDYIAWQKEKLGRDINPSELIKRILNAGAKRVAITSPIYTALDVDEVAADGTMTITYGGLEDE